MQNQPPDIIMTDYVAKAQSQAEAEQSAAPANQSSDIGSSIIPYKNPKALLGYYLGVFSILGYIPVIQKPRARFMLGSLFSRVASLV
jgi:hypothetical protein